MSVGGLYHGSSHEFTAGLSSSQHVAAGRSRSQQVTAKPQEVTGGLCSVVTCVALLRLVVHGCELLSTSCEIYAMSLTLVVSCGLLRFAAILCGINNTNNYNNKHFCIRKCMHTSCNNK